MNDPDKSTNGLIIDTFRVYFTPSGFTCILVMYTNRTKVLHGGANGREIDKGTLMSWCLKLHNLHISTWFHSSSTIASFSRIPANPAPLLLWTSSSLFLLFNERCTKSNLPYHCWYQRQRLAGGLPTSCQAELDCMDWYALKNSFEPVVIIRWCFCRLIRRTNEIPRCESHGFTYALAKFRQEVLVGAWARSTSLERQLRMNV